MTTIDGNKSALILGSNNWVLSGAHTASGKPLLANDMHLPHRIPNTWYEVHLTSGDFDVAGASLPGVPCVIVGHNRRIAWGFTNLGPDVQDLYVETFNQRGEYLTPQGWRRPAVRHEVIRVKHGRDRVLDVIVTRHGPIITPAIRLQQTAPDSPATGDSPPGMENRLAGTPKRESRQLALRWTLYDTATPANATTAFAGGPGPASSFPFFDLNAAGNWGGISPRAFAYGQSGAKRRLCRRRRPHRLPGNRPDPHPCGRRRQPAGQWQRRQAHEWTGYIPFDELPRLFDPPSGIIATANNRITADGYPYLITTHWGGPYRAERIHHVLHSDKKFTRDDMLALQNDIYSGLDRFLAERFVYAVDQWPQAPPRAREAAALLRQWTGAWQPIPLPPPSSATPAAISMRLC